jgi:hypothetical protein
MTGHNVPILNTIISKLFKRNSTPTIIKIAPLKPFRISPGPEMWLKPIKISATGQKSHKFIPVSTPKLSRRKRIPAQMTTSPIITLKSRLILAFPLIFPSTGYISTSG